MLTGKLICNIKERTLLTVMVNLLLGCVAIQGIESPALDYQRIKVSETDGLIEIGVQYNDSNACTNLRADVFTRSDIIGNDEPIDSYPVESVLRINFTNDHNTQMFIRVVAEGDITATQSCPVSQNYYRFMQQGMMSLSSPDDLMVRIPLPDSDVCSSPTIQWPKKVLFDGQYCHCLPIENGYYSFIRCVQNCQTGYSVELSSDGSTVVFGNYRDDFAVQCLCTEDPCNIDTPCILETVVASYSINVERQSSTTMSAAKNQSAMQFLLFFSMALSNLLQIEVQ